MSTIAILKFMLSAIWFRRAYIDLDGTLLYRQRCPADVTENHLQWWIDNLGASRVIESRMRICRILHCWFGVRLYVWTNRYWHHAGVTYQSLRADANLFRYFFFSNGQKTAKYLAPGPCMDDQKKYTEAFGRWSLLVEQL